MPVDVEGDAGGGLTQAPAAELLRALGHHGQLWQPPVKRELIRVQLS